MPDPADTPRPPADSYPLNNRAISKALCLLALPVLGEQFCNIAVGLVDTFLAGQISKDATAAVGLASYVGWLATMLTGFVGVGSTAVVARASGRRDRAEADHITNQSLALAAIVGAALMIGLLAAAGSLPRMMGLADDAAAVATRYLRIDAFGQFMFAYLLIGAACLRGAGNTLTPMLIMIGVNVVNIIVSAGLSLGVGPLPAWGVTGIAVGTVTARSVGGVAMVWTLFRGRSGLQVRWADMGIRLPSARRLLSIGGPAGLDSALMWSGHFIFLTFITRVTPDTQTGIAAYAAHMIGVRIESFSYLPAMAWGIAAATLVGQALGSGAPRQAVRTGHLAVLQLVPFSLLITAVYYLSAETIYDLWSNDPAVQAQGVPALRLGAFAQPALIPMIIYISALRGAGDTRFPLVFTVVGVFGVRIPVAYYCGVVLKGGLFGAWIGMCSDLVLRALLAASRFSRARWTAKSV